MEEEGVGPRFEAAAGVLVDRRVGSPRRKGGEGYRERERGSPAPVRPPHLVGSARSAAAAVTRGLWLLLLLSSLGRRRGWNVRDSSRWESDVG